MFGCAGTLGCEGIDGIEGASPIPPSAAANASFVTTKHRVSRKNPAVRASKNFLCFNIITSDKNFAFDFNGKYIQKDF